MARERKLTHEERVLWSKVAGSARPLDGHALPKDWTGDERVCAPETAAAKAGSKDRSGSARTPAAEGGRQPAATPALNPIERPVQRKIARGRLPLEARIDLHGLMQAEAHDLLHDFLIRAHQRGLRHVLVITGKGTSRGGEGVLRRGVPQWLAKPEFRSLVSGYEQAARTHGGEGALYIRLKRRRGDRA